MSPPLRLLFVHGPAENGRWRAGFDLAQAAAALDVPLQLGFAGAGLRLIAPDPKDAEEAAAVGAFASLILLGIEQVQAPASASVDVVGEYSLPVTWQDAFSWRSWLRQAPLQVW